MSNTEFRNNDIDDIELNKIGNDETLAIDVDGDLSDINSNKGDSSEEELILLNENNNRTLEAQTPRKAPKRVLWVDILRIFASYLVLLTHICWFYNPHIDLGSYNWVIQRGYHSLSRVCVPYFIMISGMFLLKPTKKITVKQIYSKYVYRILKTYIVWGIYYAIVNNYLIFPGKGYQPIDKAMLTDMYHTVIDGFGHLWYLSTLLGLYIATPVLKLITPNREITWYLVIVSFITVQLVPTICDITNILFGSTILDIYKTFVGTRLNVEFAGTYITYYLLGYLLSSGEFTKKQIKRTYIIGLIGFIITPILKFTHSVIIAKKDNERFHEFYNFPIVLASAGGFLFFRYTIGKIVKPLEDKEWFIKIIGVFSDCSFGVYLIHMTVFKFIYFYTRRRVNCHTFNPLFWAPTYTLIIYMICFVLIYLLRKISYFRSIS